MRNSVSQSPFRGPGVTLGIGMGGFLDGIVFHQVLQIHSMFSARLPNTHLLDVKINMFWDGIFHLLVWAITALGIALLFRATRLGGYYPAKKFSGYLLLGWGLFNLIEGTINHHLLQLHHVYETAGLSIWDYIFLVSGACLVATGGLLSRAHDTPERADRAR